LESVAHLGYFESINNQDNGIKEEVIHRIKMRWLKWRSSFGVFCDHKLATGLKGNS